jgi:hypothetical protein
MALVNFGPEEIVRDSVTVAIDISANGNTKHKDKRLGASMIVLGGQLEISAGTFKFASDGDANLAAVDDLTGDLDSDWNRDLGKASIKVPQGADFCIVKAGGGTLTGYVNVAYVAETNQLL